MHPTNKLLKILLGLATISWVVVLPAFFGIFFYLISTAPSDPKQIEEHVLRYAGIINFFGFLYTIFMTAVLVFFVAHAARNQELEKSQSRTTWLLTIIFLGGLVMPFYWFWYIWPDRISMFEASQFDPKSSTGI